MLSQYAANDGETLHVAVKGQGPALIFLHGWTSNHREWLPTAQQLAASRTTYCWDARGHGLHFYRHNAPNVERMAGDLAELIRHFGITSAIVVGHSMGALTLWHYLRAHGRGVLAGICLVDQSPRLLTGADWPHGIYGDFPAARNRRLVAALGRDFAETVLRLVADGLNDAARRAYLAGGEDIERMRAYLRRLQPEPLISIWESLAAEDYRAVLPAIRVPTLLVHGSASQFYDLSVARYLQQTIPGAELSVYEGADHSPHLHDRARFVAELAAFAERCDRQPAELC